jgi:hypothetical protein
VARFFYVFFTKGVERMMSPIRAARSQRASRIVSIDLQLPESSFAPVLEQIVRRKGGLTRDEAAGMMGMTVGGFSRSFRSEFGWSFRQIQFEVRLQIAACSGLVILSSVRGWLV